MELRSDKDENLVVSDSVVDLTKAIMNMWEWTHHPYVTKSFPDQGITKQVFVESLFKEMRSIKEGMRKDLIMFAIKYKDKVVGFATVSGGSEANYTIVTAEDNWKKGRAILATDMICDFLFNNGVNQINVKFPEVNKAAKQFFKKLGFKPYYHILKKCGETN